jgi:hypothetical protein
MNRYLGRLKSVAARERLPAEPSKPSKATFEGFEGGSVVRFSIPEPAIDGPDAWRQGLARLNPACPPGDVPARRWVQFLADGGRFLDDAWAARAAELGWGPHDLFGCDPIKPYARVGRLGLVWLLNGAPIAAMAADCAVIFTPSGGRLKYYRDATAQERLLPWELVARSSRNSTS